MASQISCSAKAPRVIWRSAPLPVAMALEVERDEDFLRHLRVVLAAYVLLAALGLAALAGWLGRGRT